MLNWYDEEGEHAWIRKRISPLELKSMGQQQEMGCRLVLGTLATVAWAGGTSTLACSIMGETRGSRVTHPAELATNDGSDV